MSIHDMVRVAIALAQQGVVYQNKKALCPLCEMKMRTQDTKHVDGTKVRWHKCRNGECLIGSMALLVKSVDG